MTSMLRTLPDSIHYSRVTRILKIADDDKWDTVAQFQPQSRHALTKSPQVFSYDISYRHTF